MLWAGGTTGLYRIDASGTRVFGVADGLPVSNVTALLEDRAGHLWVATIRGIARLDGDRFVAYGRKEGLPADRIRSLYEDASRALWIGTFDSGLSRYKDGRFTTYTTQTASSPTVCSPSSRTRAAGCGCRRTAASSASRGSSSRKWPPDARPA